MKKKTKFPYDYKSFGLPNGAVATFIGNPTPELIKAVTALAEVAKKKPNSTQNDKRSVATDDQ